jgi:hypothetical protein
MKAHLQGTRSASSRMFPSRLLAQGLLARIIRPHLDGPGGFIACASDLASQQLSSLRNQVLAATENAQDKSSPLIR